MVVSRAGQGVLRRNFKCNVSKKVLSLFSLGGSASIFDGIMYNRLSSEGLLPLRTLKD